MHKVVEKDAADCQPPPIIRGTYLFTTETVMFRLIRPAQKTRQRVGISTLKGTQLVEMFKPFVERLVKSQLPL